MPRKAQEGPAEVPDGALAGLSAGASVVRTKAGDIYFAPSPRPVAWRRLGEEGEFYVAKVQKLVAQLGQLDDELNGAIASMRTAGISWDIIGVCVGMTGEGARKRWG